MDVMNVWETAQCRTTMSYLPHRVSAKHTNWRTLSNKIFASLLFFSSTERPVSLQKIEGGGTVGGLSKTHVFPSLFVDSPELEMKEMILLHFNKFLPAKISKCLAVLHFLTWFKLQHCFSVVRAIVYYAAKQKFADAMYLHKKPIPAHEKSAVFFRNFW